MKCALCNDAGATKWVLDDGSKAAVAWACAVHSEPIKQLLEAGIASGVLPRRAVEMPVIPHRGKRIVRPLDWAPPE